MLAAGRLFASTSFPMSFVAWPLFMGVARDPDRVCSKEELLREVWLAMPRRNHGGHADQHVAFVCAEHDVHARHFCVGIFVELAQPGSEGEIIMIDSTHLKAHRTASPLRLKKGGALARSVAQR